MALSESTTGQPEKAPHETSKDKREKPCTKVIIRRLPPGITEKDFLTQVSPVPEYDYIYTVKGDMSLGENAFSRVYMNFCHTEDVYMFKEKFDNYVFVDTKGHEYPAVVEYASFQKVPKRRKARTDPKVASLETDPLYIEFLESLKEQPNQEEKPEFSYQLSTTDSQKEMTTPLLDFIKQRKMDRMRVREEKREERRKKEIERKKLRDDDRRKRIETKNSKQNTNKSSDAKEGDSKESKAKDELKEIDEAQEKPVLDKPSIHGKGKDKKFEDRKMGKGKYNKYDDKKDFKNRRDDFYHRTKFEEGKKFEAKEFPKKVKKYSERREERKIEANKAEAKKEERQKDETKTEDKVQVEDKESSKSNEVKERRQKSEENYEDGDGKYRNKDNDPRLQRRIKNKDRPAMVLYKPGMLRKKSVDNDKDSKDGDKDKDKPSTSGEQD